MEPTSPESSQIAHSETISQKETEWKSKRDEFQHTTDKLGLNIDEGIMDTVVAINILGINTSGSCEGHIDHGQLAPWIDIEPKEVDLEFEKRVHAAWDTAYKSDKEGVSQDEKRRLFGEANRLSDEFRAGNLKETMKLVPFLEEFYKKRDVPFTQRLVLDIGADGSSRLLSQGGKMQIAVTEDEKINNLTLYQQEMRAFTEFMKQKFMSSPINQSQ